MFDRHGRAPLTEEMVATTYDDNVGLTAADVAAELRRRIPGLPILKLHKLLYYCQGHHMAATGQPLFSDSVMAFDNGPLVSHLWKSEQEHGPNPSGRPLDEAGLNTVGYVVFRYGRLTGRDLVNLTHSEDPWQRADEGRPPGSSVRIEPEIMRQYFSADADDAGADEVALDPADVAEWLAGASERLRDPTRWDSVDELRRRANAS